MDTKKMKKEFEEKKDEVCKKADEACDTIKKQAKKAAKTAKEAGEKVEKYVEENPKKSAGAAFGIGAAFGALVTFLFGRKKK